MQIFSFDRQHPLLRRTYLMLVYAAIWLIIIIIQSLFIVKFANFDWIYALTDSLVHCTIFGFLGIIIWYAFRYNEPDANWYQVLVYHFTAGTVIIGLWIFMSFYILWLFIGQHPNYYLYNESLPWRVIMGIVFYSVLTLVYYLVVYYQSLQDRIVNEAKLQTMVQEAQLNMLKSQINPHFLFNSLNSISSLTITNPDKAREMLIKLSDFLRYSISTGQQVFTLLKAELENIERYLEIEKTRFGSKLNYINNNAQECLECKIPGMILQPLFENAIKHGVYECTETVTINANCNVQSHFLKITIVNNFDPEAIVSKKGASLGLKNIRERLKLIYKSDQLLQTNVNNNIFTATLFIPQNI